MRRRLTSARLVLDALSPGDFPILLHIQSNATAMRYITGSPRTPKAIRAFHERELAFWETRGFGYYIARYQGEPIAYLGLRAMDPPYVGDFEIGYAAVGHARQGFAFEALTALMDEAFSTLSLPRLLATVAKPHEASLALAAKLKMQPFDESPYDGFDCVVFQRAR